MSEEALRSELAAELHRHVGEEEEILKGYHELSDKLPDGPLSILVNQIVTEEEMHHFLLRTLAEWMEDPPDVMEDLAEYGLDKERVLRQTRDLQEHEQKTIESCRGLIGRLFGPQGELFACLLEAIALDSEKHARLLKTVEEMVESSK